jgi:hypothetical protein
MEPTEEELKWIRALKRVMKRQPASVRLVIGRWSDSIVIARSHDDDPRYHIRYDSDLDIVKTPYGIVTLD